MKVDVDEIYRRACAAVAHKSDPSRGKTRAEWGKEWGKGEQAARRRVAQFLEAGLMIEDKDWREIDDGSGSMRREPVYRWTAKAKATKGAKR